MSEETNESQTPRRCDRVGAGNFIAIVVDHGGNGVVGLIVIRV